METGCFIQTLYHLRHAKTFLMQTGVTVLSQFFYLTAAVNSFSLNFVNLAFEPRKQMAVTH